MMDSVNIFQLYGNNIGLIVSNCSDLCPTFQSLSGDREQGRHGLVDPLSIQFLVGVVPRFDALERATCGEYPLVCEPRADDLHPDGKSVSGEPGRD